MHSKIAAYDQALQLRCGHGVHEYHHDNDLKEIGIADTHRPWAALNEPERRAYWDSATTPGNHLPTFHSKGGT